MVTMANTMYLINFNNFGLINPSVTEIKANDYAPVTEIPMHALAKYPNVAYFEVAPTVTKIESGAFENSKLVEIHFVNKGRQITTLEENAFKKCSELRKVSIPLGVTEIPFGCFFYCSKLENVKMHNGITKIFDGAFGFCKKLKKMDFYEGLQTVETQAFFDVDLESLHFHGKIDPSLYKPFLQYFWVGNYPKTIWVDQMDSLREAKRLFPNAEALGTAIKFNPRLSSPETYKAIVSARADQKEDEAAKFSKFVQTLFLANSRNSSEIPYLPKEIMLEILKHMEYQDAVDTTRSVVPIGFSYWVGTQYIKYRNLVQQMYKDFQKFSTDLTNTRVEEIDDDFE